MKYGIFLRNDRQHSFAVHTLVPHIKDFRPASERITVLRINSRPIDLILVYVPKDTSEDDIKDTFYKDLDGIYDRKRQETLYKLC